MNCHGSKVDNNICNTTQAGYYLEAGQTKWLTFGTQRQNATLLLVLTNMVFRMLTILFLFLIIADAGLCFVFQILYSSYQIKIFNVNDWQKQNKTDLLMKQNVNSMNESIIIE